MVGHFLICIISGGALVCAGYVALARIFRFSDRSQFDVVQYLRTLPPPSSLSAVLTFAYEEEWPDQDRTYVARQLKVQAHEAEEYSRRMLHNCSVLHQYGRSDQGARRSRRARKRGFIRELSPLRAKDLDTLVRLSGRFRFVALAMVCRYWLAIIILNLDLLHWCPRSTLIALCTPTKSFVEQFESVRIAAVRYLAADNPAWAEKIDAQMYFAEPTSAS